MKNKLLLVAVSLLLTSCATIFSKKEYEMHVTTNSKNASVKVNDTDYKLPALIVVKRSKEPLKMVFTNDSLQKDMTLRSRLRPYFFIGNLFFYPPISHIIDLTSVKKYYYKNNVYIKVQDTSVKFSRISIDRKIGSIFTPSLKDETGNLKLHYSFPNVNHLYFQPRGENKKNDFGFVGISGGLDYFYNKNTFVSIQADAKTSFFFPFPLPIDRDGGEYSDSSSLNFSISNNRKLNKFTYGYGLNYAVNIWKYSNEYYDELNYRNVEITKRRVNQNLGLHLNSYFQISKNFYIGAVYQPSILNLDSGAKLQYKHSISLDFAWKVTLFNLKK